MAVSQMIGAKIHRREDPRLVSGEGRYIDDFTRPGTVFLAVVRSPFPHALIKSIDVTNATKAPGVVAVYTHKDIAKVVAGTMPAAPAFVAEKKQIPPRFPIAEHEVAYQGEPVAVVLAETRYGAADAANLVDVDYEQLPAVMDINKALESSSPKAHSGAPDNLGWDLAYIPDNPAAMKEADVVVKQRILQQRLAPTPMEPRGVLAEYSRPDGTMTIWMSSQNPHFIRLFLAGALGIPETRIRVISPDVGGGFGSKISPYSEDYLVPAAAKLSGRPGKWIETRTESLQTTTHGRGQVFDIEAGVKKDGTLVALKVTQYLDIGAYVGTFGAFQACACLLSTGAYNWKHVSARTIGVLTNRVPTDPSLRAHHRPPGGRVEDGPGGNSPQELHHRLSAHEPLRPGVRLRRLRESDGHGDGDHRLREGAP
jgi:aerobic carbon-monoxide dehydrogenase large subunit